MTLHLKIITPKKIILEEDISSITLPSAEGEMTVLPKHQNLFALLQEGVMKIKKGENEDYLAIGGGYLETDGKSVTVLVSRAYGQDEIDKNLTDKAVESAKKVLAESKNHAERHEAMAGYRKAVIDLTLLNRKRRGSRIIS